MARLVPANLQNGHVLRFQGCSLQGGAGASDGDRISAPALGDAVKTSGDDVGLPTPDAKAAPRGDPVTYFALSISYKIPQTTVRGDLANSLLRSQSGLESFLLPGALK
jgi:hypothetical protein